MTEKTPNQKLVLLQRGWLDLWPSALAQWSRFTLLREPVWCYTDEQAAAEGLTESFAMIRLTDQSIVINLAQVAQLQLDQYGLEIMAHEIGHHILCPANLTDNARMIARMRWALPTRESTAEFIGNLYTDLLINDRLQRSAGLKIADVYKTIGGMSKDAMWSLYMRIYEILWALPRHTLVAGDIDSRLEGDAQLGARLIRSYAREWLDGAGRFAALCLPYLLENGGTGIMKLLGKWRDTKNAGAGGMPAGLTEIETGEVEGAIHPALDDSLEGEEEPGADSADGADVASKARPADPDGTPRSAGQHREPFEYGAILKALGMTLDDHEIAVRYYRERAMPYLIKFPSRILPESTEPLPEGLEPWDIGDSLDQADWVESVFVSPRVIPGLTTVQRVWGTTQGSMPERMPLDLDVYIDCSGSMLNPQINISYLALAATIVTLSALRAGARVQATLWSGAREFVTTDGFITDEHRILEIITGYLGGSTAFPIHILRDTYKDRKPADRATTILIISDDGVTTIYGKDEQGNDGGVISRMALKNARGGGTMALNLYEYWDQPSNIGTNYLLLAQQDGWRIHPVRDWNQLIDFARKFSAMTYAPD